jgi:hypothetical protein
MIKQGIHLIQEHYQSYVSRLIQLMKMLSSIELQLNPTTLQLTPIHVLYLLSQACKLEDVMLMEEVPITFPKDILNDVSGNSKDLEEGDLHMGIANRETTTWMLAIHMKVGKTPPLMIHSYALNVKPKEKKFFESQHVLPNLIQNLTLNMRMQVKASMAMSPTHVSNSKGKLEMQLTMRIHNVKTGSNCSYYHTTNLQSKCKNRDDP